MGISIASWLNSDRFGRGKRIFLIGKIPINEAFSVLMFATQATDHNDSNVSQQRVDIRFYYNLLYQLRRTGIFGVDGRDKGKHGEEAG